MINIITTPPETFFAGNPALYGIFTANAVSVFPRKCSFELQVTAADVVADHHLTFTFPNKVLDFVTKWIPDDSGLQIMISTNPAYYDTWAQILFTALQTNFTLTSIFNISILPASGGMRKIMFESIEASDVSSPVITTNLVTVAVANFISAREAEPRNGFMIVGGIWDSSFKQVIQDVKPVNSYGAVMFNFSEYLSILLDNDRTPRFTWPFDLSEKIKCFTNYALPFYAGFAERYDGVIRKITFDTIRNAFPGGLNRETIVAYNAAGKEFFSVAENLLAFMTWAPSIKMTSKTTPELLFFYATSKPAFTDFSLYISIAFTDGTFDSLSIGWSHVSDNDVYELSVGYEHLDFETLFPSKTVAQWSVTLHNDELQIDTETRTFILDNQFYENERVFIFQNSYGRAYDVIRLTGLGSSDIDVDFSTSSSETIGLYNSFNAPVSKFAASEVQKLKCNTGWITWETKDYLRELLLSKQVFEYKRGGSGSGDMSSDPGNASLYPVIITNDKMKEYFADDQYLYDLEISYDRAYRDFFFQDL
jgi:hypothetical protein